MIFIEISSTNRHNSMIFSVISKKIDSKATATDPSLEMKVITMGTTSKIMTGTTTAVYTATYMRPKEWYF